jgi:L-ascorbate metabolism protein UlaG (beta-lactamase superfamily)
MDVTYYGHSTVELTIKDTSILIDPFITPNPHTDALVDDLDPDIILVSHGHQDHIADAKAIAAQSKADVITNFEIANWLQERGIETTTPVNHGGTVETDVADFTYINAVHSSVLPDGTYGGNPGGFIIQTDTETVYFSGDTALHTDMKLHGERYQIGTAFLCIGGTFTMDANDAAEALDFLQCDEAIGIHYDTFPPIEIDHDDAKQVFEDKGKTLRLLDPDTTHQT